MSAFPEKDVTKVQPNGIIVMRGWVGVKYPGKKSYVTLNGPIDM